MDNPTESTGNTNAHGLKTIRWWPLAVVVVLAIIGTLWVQRGGDVDRQRAFMTAILVWIGAGIGGVVWLLFLSRIPFKKSLVILALLAVGGGIFGALVQVRGVSGDLVPIFEWRWASEKTTAAPELSNAAEEVPLPGVADYPQFFGPNRDGKLPGPALVRDWTTAKPVELWRRPVGAGWSGFAISGRRAVTQEQLGEDEAVVCYDVENGKIVWIHKDTARYFTTLGGLGPRATPTLHEGRVFALGATGILNCLDLATGKPIWSTNIVTDNAAPVPDWGVAGSPLIWKDLVIVSAGGPDGRSLVAYRQADGEVAWTGGSDGAHWSSPAVHEIAGREQILIFNANNLAGHDAATGAVLWEYPWKPGHPHVALPVVLPGDRVILSSGYGTGAQLFRVLPPVADDTFGIERVWRSLSLKAKFANFLDYDGQIYGLDDGILTCVNPESGKRHWKEGRFGHGQLILVHDLLLIMAESGEIVLVEPSPDEPRELARFPALTSKTWNPPALAGEFLLVRNNKEAVCLRLPVIEPAE